MVCDTQNTHKLPIHFIVKLPECCKKLNLSKLGLYQLIIGYLRRLWPEKWLVTDGGSQDGLIVASADVKSYATASVQNTKYGSSLMHGGKAYSYGYVDGRVAARIDYLFHISIAQSQGLPPLKTDIALVRRFNSADAHIKAASKPLPWDIWCVSLLIALAF
jgi:hypothetical protein